MNVGPWIFAAVPLPTPLLFAGGSDSSALGLIIHKARMHTHTDTHTHACARVRAPRVFACVLLRLPCESFPACPGVLLHFN